uniref:Uncharacterized protein n=1 Tax=Arundo donax TaxID=35708 RepID=A0A0A9QHZ1_ARUDO
MYMVFIHIWNNMCGSVAYGRNHFLIQFYAPTLVDDFFIKDMLTK